MKSIALSALLLCAAPVALIAQVKYTLTGKVGTLNAPAKVHMRYYVNGDPHDDSAVLKNGVFTFKGTLAGPVKSTLTLYHDGMQPEDKRDMFIVYLEGGAIKLSSSDSLKNAVVKGSKLNDDYKRLSMGLEVLDAKSRELNAELTSAGEEKRKDTAFMGSINRRSIGFNLK